METMTLEKPKIMNYVYNSSELSNRVNETMEKIENWIKENNYRINKPIYRIEVKNLYGTSKNQDKKINKCIFALDKKLTLRKVNYFFHLLSKITGVEKIYVKVSEKEENIQKSRKKMLALRTLYEQVLAEYKNEKGDFYKIK